MNRTEEVNKRADDIAKADENTRQITKEIEELLALDNLTEKQKEELADLEAEYAEAVNTAVAKRRS